MRTEVDVVIIGAGHNGLVAALLLARSGLDVLVLEAQDIVGGAARSERPFAKAPDLTVSTGAYLLGLMPPELLQICGVDLPLKRRDPYYFLPRLDNGYLLFSSDARAMKDQFLRFFSERDWRANQAMLSASATGSATTSTPAAPPCRPAVSAELSIPTPSISVPGMV